MSSSLLICFDKHNLHIAAKSQYFVNLVDLQEFLNSRQMTDGGPLDLIDDSEDENNGKDLSLPGVRKGSSTW